MPSNCRAHSIQQSRRWFAVLSLFSFPLSSPYSSCPDHLNFYGWQFRSELSRELTPPHLAHSSRWTFILGAPGREKIVVYASSQPAGDDATRHFFIRLFPSCYRINAGGFAWLKNRFERGKGVEVGWVSYGINYVDWVWIIVIFVSIIELMIGNCVDSRENKDGWGNLRDDCGVDSFWAFLWIFS